MFLCLSLSWLAPQPTEAQIVLLPKSSPAAARRNNAQRKSTKPQPDQNQPSTPAATNAVTSTNTVAAATNLQAKPNRPVYVRVEPKIDPAKAAAERETVLKNTIEWEKTRANNGAAWAQYKLGLRYLAGDGVEKDENAGRKWIQAAADSGDRQARAKLQLMDSKGSGPAASAPDSPTSR